MNFKISSSLIQNKSIRDLESSSKEYPTLDDLMREQNTTGNKANTVHRRRDSVSYTHLRAHET